MEDWDWKDQSVNLTSIPIPIPILILFPPSFSPSPIFEKNPGFVIN